MAAQVFHPAILGAVGAILANEASRAIQQEQERQNNIEERQQALQRNAEHRQSKSQEKESVKEEPSAVPAANQPLLSKGYDGIGSTGDSKSQTRSQEKRCYGDEELLPIERSIERQLQAGSPINTATEDSLTNHANSREQINRLQTIYANPNRDLADAAVSDADRSILSVAVPRYQNFMHQEAVRNGREVMDRGQDVRAAIHTDQKSYQALRQEFSPKEATLAISTASPNTADLTKEEKEAYENLIQTPDYLPIKGNEMTRSYDGGVRGSSDNDLVPVLVQNYGRNIDKPTEYQTRMFEAELANLYLDQNIGEKLEPEIEYQRQLGEQIKLHGREGLAQYKDECQPEKMTVDQFIAARMVVSGFDKEDVESAVEKHSPNAVLPSNATSKLYIQQDIEPVTNSSGVESAKYVVDDWRSINHIPQDIKRSDCLENIFKATTSGTWNPERPEETCPGYRSSDRRAEIDLDFD